MTNNIRDISFIIDESFVFTITDTPVGESLTLIIFI